jgi:hypothetical protein
MRRIGEHEVAIFERMNVTRSAVGELGNGGIGEYRESARAYLLLKERRAVV